MLFKHAPSTVAWALVLGLACVVVGLSVRHESAEAQVPVVDGKGKVSEYFHRSKWVTSRGFAIDLYTVPRERRLFITDIVAGNDGTVVEWVDVRRKTADGGSADDVLFPIPPKDCKTINFMSGMVFDANETVVVAIRPSPPGAPGVQFNLRGYTVKLPTRVSAMARYPRFDAASDDTGFDERGQLGGE